MRQRTFDFTEPQLARLASESERSGQGQAEIVRAALEMLFASRLTPYPTSRATSTAIPSENGSHQPGHQQAPQPGSAGEGVGGGESLSLGGGGEHVEQKGKTRTPRASSPPPAVLPFPAPDELPDVAAREATRSRTAELRWRIEECWRDHLLCREGFYREQNGSPPGVHPALTDEIAKAIRDQLLAHDRDLLGPADRDRWRRESRVRAAGCGVFNDPWCSGRHTQNDATNGGTRYLEPWRPWKRLHGKPDPVPRFAQLYFEIRDAEEVAAERARR